MGAVSIWKFLDGACSQRQLSQRRDNVGLSRAGAKQRSTCCLRRCCTHRCSFPCESAALPTKKGHELAHCCTGNLLFPFFSARVLYESSLARFTDGMDGNQLTTAQARQLHAHLAPMLGYLNKLRSRMDENGFPRDDRLLLKITEARDAMHGLCVRVHYMTCKTGVGKPPRD